MFFKLNKYCLTYFIKLYPIIIKYLFLIINHSYYLIVYFALFIIIKFNFPNIIVFLQYYFNYYSINYYFILNYLY